jgi:diguanylate cyclase (GGDEF)-like protein/PAS domain S-box-containing protein
MLAMAIYPNVDRPWHFGIHQCSYNRTWEEQEIRLFNEIGRRISDGLNSLLVTRNLRESEERYHQFFDNSPLPIREEDFSAVKSYLEELQPKYGDDLLGYLTEHKEVLEECAHRVRVIDVNHTAVGFHEADSSEMLLKNYLRMFVSDSFSAFLQVVVALMQGKTEFNQEAIIQTLTGRRQIVSGYFSVSPGFEHSLGKVLVSLVDITDRKQQEDQLRLASSVFSNSQESILVSDPDNRIIDINPAFTRTTGYTREEVLGEDPKILSSEEQSSEFYAEMWESINSRGEWKGEIWNKRKSGEIYPELLSIAAVKDENGQLQHYVGAFTDITMLKQHEADLDRIAHYDVLTSVPNRRLLDDRLAQAIANANRRSSNLAVCYLDLDGFKPINDEYGHEAGDLVLIEISNRLQSMLRAADTIARLGGDEFVLLWNDVGNKTDCIRALERILDTISKPIQFGDNEVSVSASIGVTLYPDDKVDADSLLRHADHAMYSAKQLGKNCYQMFDTKLERQISTRVDFMDKIKRALEEGQFELYYQPKVDYFANSVQGVEALLRWNDPILGLVGPKEFLPLIENENLACDVGRWVMGKAVQQANIWNDMGMILPISINIFPRHIKNRNFTEDLGEAIKLQWPDMPSGRLQMEIVESSALEDLDLIDSVIEECKRMGVSFSLDDFGTGYSSLVYLRRLTIDEIKIDQSFVRDMLNDPNDQAIVMSVIGLGEAFGLRVVAEGVETTQHAWHLMDLGCRVVQGYALGRPMPVNELEKWYAEFLTTGVKMYR